MESVTSSVEFLSQLRLVSAEAGNLTCQRPFDPRPPLRILHASPCYSPSLLAIRFARTSHVQSESGLRRWNGSHIILIQIESFAMKLRAFQIRNTSHSCISGI